MNKELKRCLLTALIIAALVFVFLFLSAKELTMSFELPPEATGGSVTVADESVVGIVSQECCSGYLVAVFKAGADGTSAGHVNFEPVDNDELSIYGVDLEFSTTFFGGVCENVSGVFSGWHSVVWGICAFLLVCSFILFYGYIVRRKKQRFSYVTVACAGLGLFTLILGVYTFFFALECVMDTGMTMWVLYMQIFTACQSFVIYTSPLVVIFCFALIASNIVLLRREGFAFSNLFGIATSVFALAAAGFGIWMFYSPVNFAMRNIVCNVYAAFFCYYECMMFAVMLCALSAAGNVPDLSTEYVLILGCQIRPDGSLYPIIRARVDRALEFSEMQEKAGVPKCIFLPTGGKGSDEQLAEAEGMARYLRQHGVPDDRILIEKQSTTTWENMLLSRSLLERQGRGGAKCAFVTSSFHVFRSGMLAAQAGWFIDGMGGKTIWYYWPNAFVREFWGLIGSRVWVHLGIMVLIALFFTLLSFIM